VSPKFRPFFAGYPGYIASTSVLVSPVLCDPGSAVGRSAVIKGASVADTGGVPVGTAGTPVSDTLLTAPSGSSGAGLGANEVHTQIGSFDLKTPGGSVQVRAGAATSDRPSSFGEVQSQSNSGIAANDFPASSFFDVFVDIDLPSAGGFDRGTVHNR
jgi:hypothetical protein